MAPRPCILFFSVGERGSRPCRRRCPAGRRPYKHTAIYSVLWLCHFFRPNIRPKTPASWPNIAPRWPNLGRKLAPHGPKIGQHSPKMGQHSSKTGQHSPQDGSKLVEEVPTYCSRKLGQPRPKMRLLQTWSSFTLKWAPGRLSGVSP